MSSYGKLQHRIKFGGSTTIDEWVKQVRGRQQQPTKARDERGQREKKMGIRRGDEIMTWQRALRNEVGWPGADVYSSVGHVT